MNMYNTHVHVIAMESYSCTCACMLWNGGFKVQ